MAGESSEIGPGERARHESLQLGSFRADQRDHGSTPSRSGIVYLCNEVALQPSRRRYRPGHKRLLSLDDESIDHGASPAGVLEE